MRASAALAIGAGVFARLTMPVTAYWVAAELTVGVLWLAARTALRAGRPLAAIWATVLGVVSMLLAGVMFILTSFFDSTWAGAVDMLVDVIRLAVTLAIIGLVWTAGSRRWSRYIRAGGEVEPRPRRTPGRWLKPASARQTAGAVTDEDVRALRDYLAAGGQADYPDSDLAAAALAEAAWRRFGRRPTRPQVARYVAEVLDRPGVPAQDVWPRAATELLLAGLRSRPVRGIDPQVRRATSGVLLTALAPDGHANPTGGEEFLAAAVSRADRGYPPNRRCCLVN